MESRNTCKGSSPICWARIPQGMPKNTYPIMTGNAALSGALIRASTPLGCEGLLLSGAVPGAWPSLCFDFVSSIAKTIYHSQASPAEITRSSRILNGCEAKLIALFEQVQQQRERSIVIACTTETPKTRLIGQKVCLDRTHVPLMLIQPEREGVLAVEFFPDSPVTPFRPPIALLRG